MATNDLAVLAKPSSPLATRPLHTYSPYTSVPSPGILFGYDTGTIGGSESDVPRLYKGEMGR